MNNELGLPTSREEVLEFFRKMEDPREFEQTKAMIDEMSDEEIADACVMMAGWVTLKNLSG